MFLQISELSVHYAGRPDPAVAQVSLGLEAGEIGVLIGPSGCGKTTLLRAVAGLEPVQGGRIVLDGAVVSQADGSLPPQERRIGMVFQDYALFPHLSVARNVAFGLHAQARAAQQERVAQVLELVGLTGSGSRYPHELSGGQQQRVALARALAPRPSLLLLDEPFSNLDVALRERLAHEVRSILKEAGTTALFVTHDQMEAFAIGDRIGVMQHARLHQWDAARTVYHRPATRFVAHFIGHGVFAPATLMARAGSVVAQTPLGDLAGLPDCVLPQHYPGGACDVLLRADDIVHDDAAPMRAQVLRKTFRGADFLYTLRLEGDLTLLAQVPSHHDHGIGDWIGIRPEVDHVMTFAREAAADSIGRSALPLQPEG